MDTFKPKDIYLPLGINPDRFRFLVKRGNIVPETPTSGQGKANTFSPETALKAGVLLSFEKFGLSLEDSETVTNRLFEDRRMLYEMIECYEDGFQYWIVTSYSKPLIILRSNLNHRDFDSCEYTLNNGKTKLYIPKEVIPEGPGLLNIGFINISLLIQKVIEKVLKINLSKPWAGLTIKELIHSPY